MMKGLAGTVAVCAGGLLSLLCGLIFLGGYTAARSAGPAPRGWAPGRIALGAMFDRTDGSLWGTLLLLAGVATGLAFIAVGARGVWGFWRQKGPKIETIDGPRWGTCGGVVGGLLGIGLVVVAIALDRAEAMVVI